MSILPIFNKKKPKKRKKPEFKLKPISGSSMTTVTHKEVHLKNNDR